jgi:hypothetical protein
MRYCFSNNVCSFLDTVRQSLPSGSRKWISPVKLFSFLPTRVHVSQRACLFRKTKPVIMASLSGVQQSFGVPTCPSFYTKWTVTTRGQTLGTCPGLCHGFRWARPVCIPADAFCCTFSGHGVMCLPNWNEP